MKSNKATTLFTIGMTLTTLGLTVLDGNKIVQITTMILGLLVAIYSVFENDKWERRQTKRKEVTDQN